MAQKHRKGLWNFIIVVTLLVCGMVFAMHYKNWIREETDQITILSGFYLQQIPYAELQEVELVPRIPELERINGFSAWEKEKGIFRDSLRPNNKIYVYVDNLYDEKIRLLYKDSIELYLNLSDSLKTRELLQLLKERKDVQIQ
ncbi:hypothetical protein [Lentiprolixibacter aurantiacus]|uniref:Uncharacterized protein n=1 Tax=Lentiprolixibacter aurantiacus TaxID=2993939 RepID=A0AAE3MJR1_9FLAO|nr:hypothetical protein [Lentiprolixibacter aurantiacus]